MIANRFNPLGAKLSAKTAKSYVQDGLVHQYDAIENIGYGDHSNETLVWKDLIGAHDLRLYSYNSVASQMPETAWWEDDAYAIDVREYNARYMGWVSNAEVIPDEFTIITTFSRANARLLSENVFAGYCDSYSSSVGVVVPNLKASAKGQVPKIAGTEIGKSQNALTTKSVALTFGILTARAYANGVAVGDVAFETMPNIETEQRIRFAWFAYYYELSFRAHSMLVYNRTLTDEEIAHNYAVDKERFGL